VPFFRRAGCLGPFGGKLEYTYFSRNTTPLNGIINFTQYRDSLAKNMVASASRLKLGCKWIFQQDNPKHPLKSIKKWLTDYKINTTSVNVCTLHPKMNWSHSGHNFVRTVFAQNVSVKKQFGQLKR
jgi:hypothetical protein